MAKAADRMPPALGDQSHLPTRRRGYSRSGHLERVKQLTERKKRAFLTVLRQTGKVVDSARAVGYADTTVLRRHYNKDEEFAQAWDEAIEAAADVLEAEAIRRGVEGVREPVYYKGHVVGHKLVYSDALLQMLLRGARPGKYRENVRVDGKLQGQFGVAVLPMVMKDVTEWEGHAAEVHGVQKTITLEPVENEQ